MKSVYYRYLYRLLHLWDFASDRIELCKKFGDHQIFMYCWHTVCVIKSNENVCTAPYFYWNITTKGPCIHIILYWILCWVQVYQNKFKYFICINLQKYKYLVSLHIKRFPSFVTDYKQVFYTCVSGLRWPELLKAFQQLCMIRFLLSVCHKTIKVECRVNQDTHCALPDRRMCSVASQPLWHRQLMQMNSISISSYCVC